MATIEQKTQSALKQYYELKAKHPDALLLFRCGDFYETYKDDAEECAHILGLTLTSSKVHGLLTGFPYHALDIYLPKLIRAGKRVAICDQLEEPKLTQKLVKRGATETALPTTQEKPQPKPGKLVLPALTKKQYELLCECIRYRSADNMKEKADAMRKGLLTAWYDATATDLEELKTLIYDKVSSDNSK